MFNLTPSPMKKLTFLSVVFLAIALFSCKKSNDETNPPSKPDYYQLKVGNYWIYQGYHIDTNGVVTAEGVPDSTYVEKDTVIRGYTFKKIVGNPDHAVPLYMGGIVRDSSGYLVTYYGQILCSDENFTDILYTRNSDSILFMGYLQMTGKDSLVETPAGTFPSITSRLKIVPTQPTDPHPVRYSYTVYGKGIGGMKAHAFFYGGGLIFETRLVRYKVN
jgi:hypothetical protein